MKATTCVRVVLPTDELVRMECGATMTVADLVGALEKRSNFQKNNGIERNGGGDNNRLEDNNSDTDPATESNLISRSKGALSMFSRGKLKLVRQESELKPGSLVVDAVEELDILEFQLVELNASGRTPKTTYQNPCNRMPRILRSSPQNVLEEVWPVSTTLIPLWGENQDCEPREKRVVCQSLTRAKDVCTLRSVKGHPEVRMAALVQKPLAGLRRRGARNYPAWRRKRRVLLFTHFQEHRQYTKVRKNAERILLRASMQLIERIQLLQNDARELVFLLRDAILGNSSVNFGELLSLLRSMMKTLTHTRLDPSLVSSSVSIDTNENFVRRLSWDIAGKDGGVTILIEGWVVTAEWGTFWRSQRKEYACLCDNMLYFFASRTHCADFVFELGRKRDGNASETSKRIMEENNPHSQIDLSETDWSVRKSSRLDEGSHQHHRNAFAFFDSKGRMRLILDVNTTAEATTWARLIAAVISRNKLFARMRELNEPPEKSEEDTKTSMDPLSTWREIMTQSSVTISEQDSLVIPLRALYSQIDRLNRTARAERYKSWTLSQALKDLQRDRVKINGLQLVGASLETNILALALEMLRCSEADQEDTSAKSRQGESIPLVSTAAKEMTALRFARRVIICSSRTHGGGDILDTLHLLFGNERFCICPDSQSMEPIEVHISKSETTATLCAQITMKMTYRVIPANSIGPMDDQTVANGADDPSLNCTEGRSVQNGDVEQQNVAKEFKVLGTYTQTFSCHLIETNDIDGSVQLQFADYDSSPAAKDE